MIRRKNKTSEAGGKVRITAGDFRGRKIKTPGGATHPMGERERIALFNMISDRVEGNYVMDLYCGGGTLGIEALSRGAIFVLGIDSSEDAVMTANENYAKLGLYGLRAGAICADITIVARTATDRYGLVIADPPYDDFNEKMIKYLPRLVLDNGTLVLSHPGEAPELKGMTLEKTHEYAAAHISVYRKTA
ncbi:RsmD family RNA methyltransferase [Candidatus Saccharibacteria bacterium]|nr:RsmD family RNA methyltransferase [Candidatus Saccharibacteria bacterium]